MAKGSTTQIHEGTPTRKSRRLISEQREDTVPSRFKRAERVAFRPEYKRLDADAVTFRLSIPREFQSSMHTSSDVRMALIFTVPHVATILLHEPFCTMLDADVSLARCLLSARAVLESVYTMLGTLSSTT